VTGAPRRVTPTPVQCLQESNPEERHGTHSDEYPRLGKSLRKSFQTPIPSLWHERVHPVTTNTQQVAGVHYKDKVIQPWDYIAANALGYFEGNVIKYVSRWRHKGGVADLRKAQPYLDKLIELDCRT